MVLSFSSEVMASQIQSLHHHAIHTNMLENPTEYHDLMNSNE